MWYAQETKSRQNPCKLKIQYRALWYLIITAVEDERVQKLGIVLLTYMLDDFRVGSITNCFETECGSYKHYLIDILLTT